MVVLAGDVLDFWSSRSGFIHMLRYTGGRNHKPLSIDLNQIENPELFNELITLDTFQKSGGLFVYDKFTGEPSINPKKGYTLDDIYRFLDYMSVNDPHGLLMELAAKQIDRPRKLVMSKSNEFNNAPINYTYNYNNNNNNNNNNNSGPTIGFKNNNEEHAYSRISNRNLTNINKKTNNKTRRGKKIFNKTRRGKKYFAK